MKLFYHIGQYLILMKEVFRRPDNGRLFRGQLMREIDKLGIDSLGIVCIISVFMGAVVTIQMAFNIDTPLIPMYTIGYATKQSVLLEFSPTIVSLILAGKVGSRVASEIGTMKVTEQVDALNIMGVNPAGYLILPKISAALIIFPVLIVISIVLGIFGGWLIGSLTGLVTSHDYIYGIRAFFKLFEVFYALIKTLVFAFIITSVSGYFGFITKGGALEVGKASTQAVVSSSIAVIVANLILTQLLLG